IVSGIGEQPAIIHVNSFGVNSFTSGCVCVAPNLSTKMLQALKGGNLDAAESIRRTFAPLEDLRNDINPIRVLHAAVAEAGIAETGPILPLLDEVDETILGICFDTGHHSYAGFDPVAFMKKHIGRISYMHFKDIDPRVKAGAIRNRTGFYDACGQGIFCNLGEGDVDFPAVRQVLLDAGFEGWCTVEQDCDPTLDVSPIKDAGANREYLESIGFK
ncbi:MAG: TIM barrel protein, partial [Paracoccus sp. (in: a-proteobacteria)]